MIASKLYISESRRDDMLNYGTQKNNIAPIWVPFFTNNISSLRDLRWASGSYFSINISSLREYIRKSRRDGMFIEPGIQSIINKSLRDDMFNIIIIQPTQKKLNYDTPKNNIAPMWVPFFTNNISSLRDLRWASGYFFSINISSLREYIRKSRGDGMFIDNGCDMASQQSRRDEMFISQRNTTLTKSINNQTFIKYGQYIYTNLHPFGIHR